MSRKSAAHPPASAAKPLAKARKTLEKVGTTAITVLREDADVAQTQLAAVTQDIWKEVQQSPAVKDAEQFVRQQPLKALLVTLGVGIMIGIGMRR